MRGLPSIFLAVSPPSCGQAGDRPGRRRSGRRIGGRPPDDAALSNRPRWPRRKALLEHSVFRPGRRQARGFRTRSARRSAQASDVPAGGPCAAGSSASRALNGRVLRRRSRSARRPGKARPSARRPGSANRTGRTNRTGCTNRTGRAVSTGGCGSAGRIAAAAQIASARRGRCAGPGLRAAGGQGADAASRSLRTRTRASGSPGGPLGRIRHACTRSRRRALDNAGTASRGLGDRALRRRRSPNYPAAASGGCGGTGDSRRAAPGQSAFRRSALRRRRRRPARGRRHTPSHSHAPRRRAVRPRFRPRLTRGTRRANRLIGLVPGDGGASRRCRGGRSRIVHGGRMQDRRAHRPLGNIAGLMDREMRSLQRRAAVAAGRDAS